jgi:hypothetical protein
LYGEFTRVEILFTKIIYHRGGIASTFQAEITHFDQKGDDFDQKGDDFPKTNSFFGFEKLVSGGIRSRLLSLLINFQDRRNHV